MYCIVQLFCLCYGIAVRTRPDKDKKPIKITRNEPEKKKFKGALISVASKITIIVLLIIIIVVTEQLSVLSSPSWFFLLCYVFAVVSIQL